MGTVAPPLISTKTMALLNTRVGYLVIAPNEWLLVELEEVSRSVQIQLPVRMAIAYLTLFSLVDDFMDCSALGIWGTKIAL